MKGFQKKIPDFFQKNQLLTNGKKCLKWYEIFYRKLAGDEIGTRYLWLT